MLLTTCLFSLKHMIGLYIFVHRTSHATMVGIRSYASYEHIPTMIAKEIHCNKKEVGRCQTSTSSSVGRF
jgi:hypothetical protein